VGTLINRVLVSEKLRGVLGNAQEKKGKDEENTWGRAEIELEAKTNKLGTDTCKEGEKRRYKTKYKEGETKIDERRHSRMVDRAVVVVRKRMVLEDGDCRERRKLKKKKKRRRTSHS